MTRVLILDTPSPLSCRSGVAVGSEHLMIRVQLGHRLGWVLCKPCEIVPDDLPEWLPEWLRLWIHHTRRGWRRYHERDRRKAA